MPRIGLRHLSTHTSEVIRNVQENRERYVITNRGEPVAVVIPYAPYEEAEEKVGSWDRLADLLEQVGKQWTSPLSAEELLNEMKK